MKGWIAVDLDGTLAKYNGWQGESHIGDPIPEMVARVQNWVSEGVDVRIFTARAWKGQPNLDECIKTIQIWCEKHLGYILPITAEKDYGMIELWDDRCVQVIPNTGRRADGLQ